jgi:hypothetical protein
LDRAVPPGLDRRQPVLRSAIPWPGIAKSACLFDHLVGPANNLMRTVRPSNFAVRSNARLETPFDIGYQTATLSDPPASTYPLTSRCAAESAGLGVGGGHTEELSAFSLSDSLLTVWTCGRAHRRQGRPFLAPRDAQSGAHFADRPTISSIPPICGSRASSTSRSIAKSLPVG